MTNLYHSPYGVALNEFRNTLNDTLGVNLTAINPDGNLHRFKIDGKLNGAYVLHLDGNCPAGYFQDFKQGIKERWRHSGSGQTYSEAERQAFKQRLIKEQEQRQKEITLLHSMAASRAKYLLANSSHAPLNHPYLVRKNIKPHGSYLSNDNRLIIPIYSKSREIVNLQFIGLDGNKRFMKGAELQVCFSVIGKVSDDDAPMAITEGWATGASVHERHGHQTFIAFSANNLKAVALALRDLFPERRLYIYGDNDLSGTGQESAVAAAISGKGVYVIPDDAGTDWNDIYSNNDTKEVPV